MPKRLQLPASAAGTPTKESHASAAPLVDPAGSPRAANDPPPYSSSAAAAAAMRHTSDSPPPMKDLGSHPSLREILAKHSWAESRWQLELGVPIMLAYLLQMGLQLTNTIMIGHIPGDNGAVQVAAAGLGSSFNNVTGSAIGIGLATALDTRLSQAFTMARAKRLPSPYKVMDPILHRFLLIVTVATVPIIIIWIYAQQIMEGLSLHGEEIRLSARYTLLSIPGLFPYFAFEALKKYVQAQGHTMPILIVLVAAFFVNLLVSYFLVLGPIDAIRLGFDGAPVATVISYYVCPPLLLLIMKIRGLGTPMSNFFDRRVLREWGPLLKLGIPGVAMLASEWWAFEICVLLAAKLGTDGVAVAAQSVTQQIASFAYMIPLGVSIAATTRVGNMIGAGCARRARVAAMNSLLLATLFALFNSLVLISLRSHLGALFTTSPKVIALLAQVLPICGFFQIADGLACVASGILKGTGKQKIGAAANLTAYYLIGLPIAIPLSGVFAATPKLGIQGFWFGLCTGLYCAAIVVCVVLFRIDWAAEVRVSYAALSKDTADAQHEAQAEAEAAMERGLAVAVPSIAAAEEAAVWEGAERGAKKTDEMIRMVVSPTSSVAASAFAAGGPPHGSDSENELYHRAESEDTWTAQLLLPQPAVHNSGMETTVSGSDGGLTARRTTSTTQKM